MWGFLIVLVVCISLIIASRVYLDIRRQELTHIRLLQSDRQRYDEYMHVSKQEAIADVKKLLEAHQQALPEAHYYQPNDPPDIVHNATHTHPITEPQVDQRRHPLHPHLVKINGAWLDTRLWSDAEMQMLEARYQAQKEQRRPYDNRRYVNREGDLFE